MSKNPDAISNIENLIILTKLHPEDHLLFLYSTSEINKFDIFFSFLQTGLENNELAAYMSADYTDRRIEEKFKQLKPTEKCRVYFGWYDLERIKQELSKLCKQIQKDQSTLRLVIDYGNMPKLKPAETIHIDKNIHEQRRKNSPIFVISAFDIKSLDHKTFFTLLKFHQKILIQIENKSIILCPNNKFDKNKESESSLEIISGKTLEKIVKNNLRLLVLGILNKTEMSGYDLIKLIHKKFKLKISPGTMYPLLFSIKKEGLLQVKKDKNDLKRKVYVLTREGKKVAENELLDFLTAINYLSDLIYNKRR